MAVRRSRLAGAVVAGLLSLLAAGWSLGWQLDRENLLAVRRPAQIAPLPASVQRLLQPAVRAAVQPPPLTYAERASLTSGLWRAPLDPKLFNLAFADAARSRQPGAITDDLAGSLARLGWRYTPAQYNLLMRALLQERFNVVLQRVDGLLRRRTQPQLAYTMLATMEAVPQVHDRVVDTLLKRPGWRRDYLSIIAPNSDPALLAARVETLQTLIASSGTSGRGRTPRVTREELAPSLGALVASGRALPAYALWKAWASLPTGGNIVYDPQFTRAAALAAGPTLGIPFEWQFNQDLGYSAQPGPDGAIISWDQRGVPVFLAQVIPVKPGRAYTLTITGSADAGQVDRLLSPALVCNTRNIRFDPLGRGEGNGLRYRSEPLPEACDMGVLVISGAVDAGTGPVTITIAKISAVAES